MDHCGHVLSVLTRGAGGPKSWLRPEYKQIRECVEVIKSHPAQFLPAVGDQLPDGSIFRQSNDDEEMKPPALTTSYISSIATFKELSSDLVPILQVITSKMTAESSSRLKKKNSTHFTYLRLRDGSNDVIMGRLSMHIAHEGNKLDCGDSICFNIYTSITYTTSGQYNSQQSPAIVIHTYSKIGYSFIPNQLHLPVHYIGVSMTE